MTHKLMTLRHARRGFTLIELLVVVLILAILMAVALPLYLNAVADSQRKTCRANMQTIANAEQAYKVKNPAHTYVAIASGADMSTVLTDLQATPICPAAGSYSVTLNSSNGSFTVHCSVPEHEAGTGSEPAGFTPGVNSE